MKIVKFSLIGFIFLFYFLPSLSSVAQSINQDSYKFDAITVRFVDALTLKPIINSKIEVHFDKYDNGQTSQAKLYVTDTNGEIVVPVEGKVYYFRSDKGDNASYLKQGDSLIINMLQTPSHTIYLNPIFDLNVKLKTDFNFLTSFFRRFRYGSYLESSQ